MKNLPANLKVVSLDTNVFIYYFDQESPFFHLSKKLFQEIISNKIQIVASILTLTELLSFKAPPKNLNQLEDEFLATPNLKLYEVNQKIASQAARIRRTYGFRLPDSIQLATSLAAKAQVFITNDQRLEKFKELKVVFLKEI